MALKTHSSSRPSSGHATATNFNSDQSTATAFYSLLDAVGSESIVDQFNIDTYSKTHDFDNHLKVTIREGIDPSSSFRELHDTTQTADQLDRMAASTFSRLSNDRDYRAVVRTLFALLHTPQLYHQRAVQRKRLEQLTRGVVTPDATNLELTRSVVVFDEFVGDDEQSYEIGANDGGLELHCAARVDTQSKHPLGMTVTEGDTHESPQFDQLRDDVEVFQYLGEKLQARVEKLVDPRFGEAYPRRELLEEI